MTKPVPHKLPIQGYKSYILIKPYYHFILILKTLVPTLVVNSSTLQRIPEAVSQGLLLKWYIRTNTKSFVYFLYSIT